MLSKESFATVTAKKHQIGSRAMFCFLNFLPRAIYVILMSISLKKTPVGGMVSIEKYFINHL